VKAAWLVVLRRCVLVSTLSVVPVLWAAAPQADVGKEVKPLQSLGDRRHPRLMLDQGGIDAWRAESAERRQELFQQLMRETDRLRRAKPPTRGRLDRGHGNMLARLAVMARLSNDHELADAAKGYLLEIVGREVWDPERDLLHGHLLWGAAIAYDWLYQDLSEAERAAVRAKLAHEAQLQYEASTIQRGYWRMQYLQNHGHVNFCGLAFAAGALAGEDDRAAAWMQLSDEFFRGTFRWSNPDGVSIEGLSYGVYALEFCLRYAELARQIDGRDYFGHPWLANMPLWILHSTLPVMNQDEWAMDFGDSPRSGNSHLPTHSLAKIAAECRDPVAQGMGQVLQRLHGTLGRDAWQTALWYDPTVPAKDRSEMPTFHHFADTGQVMMRTDWSESAMLVGLRCGPWQGHNAWRRARYDLGAAHAHPDINSFQVFAEGCWLLVDPGYTYVKRTSDHSTLLVDGAGQLGENVTWFAAEDATQYDHYAKILRTESTGQYDYVMGDATHAYHPGLGLKRFVRHWLFVKPSKTLVVIDDLATEPTGFYKAWTRQSVQFEGMEVEDPKREFLVPATDDRTGRVWFTYDGVSGQFDIDVDYFDNWPGKGRYVLSVADKVVAEWVHDTQDTDLHLRTIRNVKIDPGDKVELRGRPFGVPGKFIKMAVSSRSAPRAEPHRLEMLLHAEPTAKVQAVESGAADAVCYVIDAGKACLDVRATAPGIKSTAGEHEVLQASRIKRTQRITLQPRLVRDETEDAAVVVTVLQPRPTKAKPLSRVEAKSAPEDRSVRVAAEGPAGSWTVRIALEDGEVRLVGEPKSATP